MYAIIKTGGKQYTVEEGDKVRVEALAAEAGDKIDLVEVLAIKDESGLKVGTPFLDGAVVKATVIENGRHHKVRIFKFRRRKHSMKSGGHRQEYTELQINGIYAQAPVETEKDSQPAPELLPEVETASQATADQTAAPTENQTTASTADQTTASTTDQTTAGQTTNE